MATYTLNYDLKKPAQEDYYNVDDFNENTSKIDAEMKKLDNKISSIEDSLLQSLSANGYARVGDLLVQWGTLARGPGSTTGDFNIYFPMPFEDVYNVQFTPDIRCNDFSIGSLTTTYLAINAEEFIANIGNDTVKLYWVVIGKARD